MKAYARIKLLATEACKVAAGWVLVGLVPEAWGWGPGGQVAVMVMQQGKALCLVGEGPESRQQKSAAPHLAHLAGRTPRICCMV